MKLIVLHLQAAGAGRSNLGVHPMGYHNDNADIVFLLCLQRAAVGGEHLANEVADAVLLFVNLMTLRTRATATAVPCYSDQV